MIDKNKYEVALKVMDRWKIDVEKGEIYAREGLAKGKDVRGYKRVGTTYKGRKYTFKQHQIIVIASGLNPVGKQINHIDGDKTNNKISNLEVVTAGENLRHAFRTGLARTVNRKLGDDEVREVRRLLKEGRTQFYLAEKYGVCKAVIGRIKRGETYKNVK